MTTKRVLIVDDEPNVVASIRRVCKGQDFEVLTASSGPEALAILDSTEVQVLLSDQRMPEMTGDALFELVDRAYPYISKVLITGYTALESITRSVNNGAVYKIIYKPWHNDDLLTIIQDAFNYYHVRKHGAGNLTQQLELQKLLQQKNHELKIYSHRLEISMLLANYFPMALLGVSSDWFIAESNVKANRLFNSERLVGQRIEKALPLPMVTFLKSFSDADYEQERVTLVQYQGEHYQLTGMKIELSLKTESYLLYAGKIKNDL